MDHVRGLGGRFVRFRLRRVGERRNRAGKLRLWYVLQLFFMLTSFTIWAFPFPLFGFQWLFLPLFSLQPVLFLPLPSLGF